MSSSKSSKYGKPSLGGKNVLHPNVGFMWEIIDHMWDDPTFLCGMIPHSLIIILGVEISEERNVLKLERGRLRRSFPPPPDHHHCGYFDTLQILYQN